MPQRNNHARSKQKRKALRLKNFTKSVHEKRLQKMARLRRAKGKPLVGEAKALVPHISVLFPTGYSWNWNTGNRRDKTFNQRQKRKRFRHEPRGKKAA